MQDKSEQDAETGDIFLEVQFLGHIREYNLEHTFDKKRRSDMNTKENLKELIQKMNREQFEQFTCQIPLVLSEEAAEPVPLLSNPQSHT